MVYLIGSHSFATKSRFFPESPLYGVDLEWLSVASEARPRKGINPSGQPLSDGRVAVLQLASVTPLLGKHVHVISLPSYELLQDDGIYLCGELVCA